MQTIPQSPEQTTDRRPAAAPGGETPGKARGTTGGYGGQGESDGAQKPAKSVADTAKVEVRKPGSATTGTPDLGPSTGRGSGSETPGKPPAEPLQKVTAPRGTPSLKPITKEAPKAVPATASPSVPGPSRITTTKTTSKAPTKSPTLPKTPTSPKKPQTPKIVSKPTENRVREPEKKATPQPAAAAAVKSTPSSALKKGPSPLDASPLSRGIGFVKPKPKSPTRPVHLPASLMTHTASSGSKTRLSMSRQGGDYEAAHSGNPASRASVPRNPDESSFERGIGFVKPKPKSPTRPVHLPAGLTTHTASSGSKTRLSASRQGGNYQAAHSVRPASRANVPRNPDESSFERGIGFVKPRPKSPTRPVQLPAGLTTHTASSATKVNRQSSSRQSGSYQTLHSLGRSPSRASAATGGTLRRQSSTLGRQRPSFGPPPRQASIDHPVTRREKEMDEGFLTRMMRPTQASSFKTADKPPVTPPRQHSAPPARQPASRQTHAVSRPAESGIEAGAERPIVLRGAAAPAERAESSTAAVEQKATAGENIAIVKEAEAVDVSPKTPVLPAAEHAPAPPMQEPTPQATPEKATPPKMNGRHRVEDDEPHREALIEKVNGVKGVSKVNGVEAGSDGIVMTEEQPKDTPTD